MDARFIDLREFTYDLPEASVALYPLPERDESRLLVYRQGKITHSKFSQLPGLLPDRVHLFFNDTRVIPARMIFEKPTGATIEVFLLQPRSPSEIFALTLAAPGSCVWKCTVGNLKRWTQGLVLRRRLQDVTLEATMLNQDEGLIKFSWTPSQHSFAEVLRLAGQVPLPPYIKRSVVPGDRERYQTVYSNLEGAVAAPTAGLHFNERVLTGLKEKGVEMDFLTLHVSAGTFLPIKTTNATEHFMHTEQVVVNKKALEAISLSNKIVAVGTTAMRTLESLYWFGVRLQNDANAPFKVEQTTPYISNSNALPSRNKAIDMVLNYMAVNKLDQLTGETSIYIYPGYTFWMCDGLITNFHQPGSTLLLLIAAFIGDDWKKIYKEALQQGYRFLSYGDSSLLLP